MPLRPLPSVPRLSFLFLPQTPRSQVPVQVQRLDLYKHLGGIFACMGPAAGPVQALVTRGGYHTSPACAGILLQSSIVCVHVSQTRPISSRFREA